MFPVFLPETNNILYLHLSAVIISLWDREGNERGTFWTMFLFMVLYFYPINYHYLGQEVICPIHFWFSWISWIFLMAQSNAKMKSNYDNESPCFRPFKAGFVWVYFFIFLNIIHTETVSVMEISGIKEINILYYIRVCIYFF
jgi:hypothetical protein